MAVISSNAIDGLLLTSVLPARFPCLPRISLERALRFSINMRNVSGTRVPKTKVVNFLTESKSKSERKGTRKGDANLFYVLPPPRRLVPARGQGSSERPLAGPRSHIDHAR